MFGYTSSGRKIKLDRKAFETKMGGHQKSIPQENDLKAGRIKSPHVKSCIPLN